MKNQTTENVRLVPEKNTASPALTRAIRAAIRSNKVEAVLLRAGSAKLRGMPAEVLEEVAAAQTAAWITGIRPSQLSGPAPGVAPPKVLDAAAETIDEGALTAAAEIVGVRGSSELETIRATLIANMALTAIEAHRFAQAEDRPLDHNCVAIAGFNVARAVYEAGFGEGSPAAEAR